VGTFGESLREMDIEVTSPDRTVTLRVLGGGDIDVDLAAGALSRHTEDSLGRQVSAAVRLAIAARAHAYGEAFDAVAGRYVERW
jgi:hypothetical protein